MRRCSWRDFVVRPTEHDIDAVFESADPQDLDGLLALPETAEHVPLILLPLGH